MTVDAFVASSRAAPPDARRGEARAQRAPREHAVEGEQEFVTLLNSFRDAVRASPAIPLTGQRLVDEDVCLALVSHLRAALPPDIVALYAAQRDADALVARAGAQARVRVGGAGPRVVDDHPLVRSALDRAERLRAQTEDEARALRAGADAYARTCLGTVSERLRRVGGAVDRAEAALVGRDARRR